MKEKLEGRLLILEAQRKATIEQATANLNAFNGAIEEVNHLLTLIVEEAEILVTEVAKEIVPETVAPATAPAPNEISAEPQAEVPAEAPVDPVASFPDTVASVDEAPTA